MGNPDEEIGKMLSSSDPDVRGEGFLELWGTLQPKLEGYFRQRMGQQDLEDFHQEVFLRGHENVRDRPLIHMDAPERYVWRSAHNLWVDWQRKQSTYASKMAFLAQDLAEEDPSSVEQQVLVGEQGQEVMSLILRLPNECERWVALLSLGLDHTCDEISLLTGWDKRLVNNGWRRVTGKLQKMWKNKGEYLELPSPWETQLPSTSNQHAFCVTRFNLSPKNISPDSQQQLLKDLEVRDLYQAQEEYYFLHRTEGIKTGEVGGILTVTPRRTFKPALLDRKPMYYRDFSPHFRRVKEQGSWKLVMELTPTMEYPAQLVDISYDDQAARIIATWRLPTLQRYVCKPLTEKMVFVAYHPRSGKEHVWLYQEKIG